MTPIKHAASPGTMSRQGLVAEARSPALPARADAPSIKAPPPAATEPVRCYACGSQRAEHFIDAEDDLTGKPGRFRFVRCDDCALVYQNPRVPAQAIGAWYDDEYIAHRKQTDFGPLTRVYHWAMDRHDRRKLALVRRYVALDRHSAVLDLGCGAGTFLAKVAQETGAHVTGVDFKNLAHLPWMRAIEFRCGRPAEQVFDDRHFDLITLWHFLEHDYEPLETLQRAREWLAPAGRMVIEVPRLDSVSFHLFKERWPGLQAPQHTAVYSRATLNAMVERAGLEIVEWLPWGAFPAYFYLFAGTAFKWLKGRGLNLSRAVYPYFAGELLLAPVLAFERHLNLAMQTVVVRRRQDGPAQVRTHPSPSGRWAGDEGASGFRALRRRLRLAVQVVATMSVMTVGALVMLLVALATGFRLRRFYSERIGTPLGRMVLAIFGVRFVVHPSQPFPPGQVVYISNHTSTIDLFVLIALGLPNARYFLSGFLRKLLPLGIIGYLIGIFWTVPQDRPADRRRIFQRAAAVLKRTRESVYLSPEGERNTSGRIGRFNKGAFHLATDLQAPIVPLFLWIPRAMDPGKGLAARPGTVEVHVGAPIDTAGWRVEDVERNRDAVRAQFERWHTALNAA